MKNYLAALVVAAALAACVPGVSATPTPYGVPSGRPSVFWTPTLTPSDTPAPTVAPTSSIIEVTPRPTDTITVIGLATIPPPGVVVQEKGTFNPFRLWTVRACPSTKCEDKGNLLPGTAYPTVGWVQNEDHQLWLCEVVDVDTHGAQLCTYAILWLDKDGWHGHYRSQFSN